MEFLFEKGRFCWNSPRSSNGAGVRRSPWMKTPENLEPPVTATYTASNWSFTEQMRAFAAAVAGARPPCPPRRKKLFTRYGTVGRHLHSSFKGVDMARHRRFPPGILASLCGASNLELVIPLHPHTGGHSPNIGDDHAGLEAPAANGRAPGYLPLQPVRATPGHHGDRSASTV